MRSVVINLVTSLEIKAILGAIKLGHFGRTRNGYAATRFILLSSTAESTATSSYVVVPERFGQSEARPGRNVERTGKKPSFDPMQYVTTCKRELYLSFICSLFSILQLFSMYIFYFLRMENLFDLLFMLLFIVSARE